MKNILLLATLFLSLMAFSQGALTDNGITKKILKEGKGDKAKVGDKVKVKIKGELLNGEVFEESVMSFVVGDKQMIPGFNEVLPTMRKGEKAKVTLPPNMAYGEKEVKEDGYILIPANSTLVFEIFLINIK